MQEYFFHRRARIAHIDYFARCGPPADPSLLSSSQLGDKPPLLVAAVSGISKYMDGFFYDEDFFRSQLVRIDPEALRKGDIGPFHLAFPVGIASSEKEIQAFHDLIKAKHPSYIDAAAEYAARLASTVNNDGQFSLLRSNSPLARSYDGPYFPFFAEHIYARYLNFIGAR
jgi:hypothetical protein